jgi:hypothetical protein
LSSMFRYFHAMPATLDALHVVDQLLSVRVT